MKSYGRDFLSKDVKEWPNVGESTLVECEKQQIDNIQNDEEWVKKVYEK